MDQHAIDRENIRDLVARYNIAGDGHDIEAMMAVFTDDAAYVSVVFDLDGKPAIRAYLSRAWTHGHGEGDSDALADVTLRQHHISTTQIDHVSADEATGRIYYAVFSNIGPDHCGFYSDHYRRTAEGWKIARRSVWMEWASENSRFVPAQARQLLKEGVRGRP